MQSRIFSREKNDLQAYSIPLSPVTFDTRSHIENNIVEENLAQLANFLSETIPASDFPGWRSGSFAESPTASHTNDATLEESLIIQSDLDDNRDIGRIPIAAPVPLSFSACSKDVLKKMCSLPQKSILSPHIFYVSAEVVIILIVRAGCTSPATGFSRRTQSTGLSSGSALLQDPFVTSRLFLPEIRSPSCRQYAQLSSSIDGRMSPPPYRLESYIGPQAPFVIRPITPSTLIALTEPCLMAFCRSPLFGHFSTASVTYMASCNSWGY